MAAMKQASCEAAHVHYMSVSAGFVVGIHQGLRVKVQLHPRLMTLQTDWPFLGEEAAHTGPARERGDGGERGRDGEKNEVKFRTEGRKSESEGESKEDVGGREKQRCMVTAVDLEYILVVLVDLFSCGLPWFLCLALLLKQWINTWPRLLTLPPSSSYPLQISKYVLSGLDTHTHTHVFIQQHKNTITHVHTYVLNV